ncbi:MAG: hypothetical protein Q4C04_01120 [Clostridia bacterium]|nr:hypothetical protein [Clostridia bacterium]
MYFVSSPNAFTKSLPRPAVEEVSLKAKEETLKMKGIILLAACAILMICTTLIFTRRSKNIESFHVANRKLGTFSSAMSIAATWIWAPALLVSAEQAYKNGLPGLFWFLVPNVLCLLIFIPFAKRIRKDMPHGITLSGYMGEKYKSKKVKGVYIALLGGLSILSTGVQLLAGAKIITMVTDLPFFAVTVALALITFLYSQFSGIRASVMTDVVQMLIMLVGCALFVPWALSSGSGLQDFVAGISNSTKSGLFSEHGISVLLSFGLPTAIGLISGPFGDQCFWQRAFATRSSKIGKAFTLGSAIFAIIPLSMGVLGFVASGNGSFIPTDTGIVNLELIQRLFPAWATLPFVCMLIAGLMSTLDSNLCAVASLTTDITDKPSLGKSKVAMAILLVVGIGIANIPGLTVTHLFLIYGILRATTLIPTVLTLKGKNLTANAVFSAVLSALCIGFPLFAIGTLRNISALKIVGCVSVLLIGLVTSLVVSKIESRKEAANQ